MKKFYIYFVMFLSQFYYYYKYYYCPNFRKQIPEGDISGQCLFNDKKK